MTDTNVDEIRCTTHLTATQVAAMLAPSPSFIIFTAFVTVLWINAISASSILIFLLVGFGAMFALKFALFGLFISLNRWRARFGNNRVEFFQGKRLVATLKPLLDCKNSVSIIENRLLPRMLRITRSDGTYLDTLYGVSKSDMEKVASRMQHAMQDENAVD